MNSAVDNTWLFKVKQQSGEDTKVIPGSNLVLFTDGNMSCVDGEDSVIISGRSVIGNYTNDINIKYIHTKVLSHFDNFSTNKLTSELEDLKAMTLTNMGIFVKVKERISAIEEEMATLSNFKKEEYLKKSLRILNEYDLVGPFIKHINFDNSEVEIDPMFGVRHNIIYKYLDLVKPYIFVDVVRNVKVSNKCKSCKNCLDNLIPQDGTLTCNVCYANIPYVTKTQTCSYNVTPSNHNNYKDKDNFEKAFNRYQGKQVDILPSNIVSVLDEYFKSVNIMIGDDVKKMSKAKIKKETSRTMMFNALKCIGLSSHYEDINLICHIYWNWILPDVSDLEDTIMKDYDDSQEVFMSIKGEDRRSCLNVQYRLFRHLQIRGHECNHEDFKTITTGETFRYHQIMWEAICKELGWVYMDL
ncbi:MAG: hypothetical protein COA94_02180 [Rickettsiales bacterium]|nr:MAG: hypothetical protein COA94_02180 [Rickettsiales bacterium]